jgi:molybdate transport system permease protein
MIGEMNVNRYFGVWTDWMEWLEPGDWQAVWLTLHLATVTTVLLLILGTPLAWWLARTRSRWKPVIMAMATLPLVLPPTVLGFYLLLAMGPEGLIGWVGQALGWGSLAFTFPGLVIGSVLYSLPFFVQPLQHAFEALPKGLMEAAATLGANPWDRFLHVALPLSRGGLLAATILGFAHTLGEFGVVLMIGGNIPGVSRVLSITLYDHVEALEYGHAHLLAGLMLVFSFILLVTVQLVQDRGNGKQR